MPLRRTRKPRYVSLADMLATQIESGRFAVGGRLPSEAELSEKHAVSRHTVRAALARLAQAGLVARRRGAATRVAAGRAALRFQQDVATIDELLQHGSDTHLNLERVERAPAPAEIASLLGIAPGTDAAHLEGVRFDVPRATALCVTEFWIRIGRHAPMLRLQQAGSAVRALSELLDPSRLSQVEQFFDATRLTREFAEQLGVPSGTPALRIARRYEATDGTPLALAVNVYPAGRFSYSVLLRRRSDD